MTSEAETMLILIEINSCLRLLKCLCIVKGVLLLFWVLIVKVYIVSVTATTEQNALGEGNTTIHGDNNYIEHHHVSLSPFFLRKNQQKLKDFFYKTDKQ